MFEKFTKLYRPQSNWMEQERDLIVTYATGWALLTVFCLTMGIAFIYLYQARKDKRGMMMYLPLGTWFTAMGLLSITRVLAIWYNYLWVYAIWILICGALGLWNWVSIPKAIKERDQLRDCEGLRQEMEQLSEQVKTQEKVIDNLLNNKDRNGANPNPAST